VVIVSAETVQTLVGILIALSGFALFFDRKIEGLGRDLRGEFGSDITGLRTELKTDIAALDHKIDRLGARIDRVDDRVFALASGMKPLIKQAGRHESA
jgi:hypothetical protein